MSLYIKGMKLPKYGYTPAHIFPDGRCEVYYGDPEVNIYSAIETDEQQHNVGRWIEIRRNDVNPITGRCGVYVGCSECGAPLPTDSMLDFIDESDCKFCYNCGAEMIGGVT